MEIQGSFTTEENTEKSHLSLGGSGEMDLGTTFFKLGKAPIFSCGDNSMLRGSRQSPAHARDIKQSIVQANITTDCNSVHI